MRNFVVHSRDLIHISILYSLHCTCHKLWNYGKNIFKMYICLAWNFDALLHYYYCTNAYCSVCEVFYKIRTVTLFRSIEQQTSTHWVHFILTHEFAESHISKYLLENKIIGFSCLHLILLKLKLKMQIGQRRCHEKSMVGCASPFTTATERYACVCVCVSVSAF